MSLQKLSLQKQLLECSRKIRDEIMSREDNKDCVIGILSMQLAIERSKNVTNPPDDVAYDPEYYEKAIRLLADYGISMEAFPLAYRLVETSALLENV